jgi:hypothetical protein
MKLDPTTAKGKAEINKILKRRETEAEEARKRSEENRDDEHSGKFTSPNEVDLHRDRNNDENGC